MNIGSWRSHEKPEQCVVAWVCCEHHGMSLHNPEKQNDNIYINSNPTDFQHFDLLKIGIISL